MKQGNGFKDISGQKFGRLTAIRLADSSKVKSIKWLCVCDCGKEKDIFGINLRSGLTQSCGCIQKEKTSNIHRKHGVSNKSNPEYRAWNSMKTRCYNKNRKGYKNWGGKGIIVCDRWLDEENGFLNFISDVGERPTEEHSLDRYPNKNGNYEPGNVRWATEVQQQGNRSNNKWIECDGRNMILQDWARAFGVSGGTLWRHLKKGKPFESIVDFYKNKNASL